MGRPVTAMAAWPPLSFHASFLSQGTPGRTDRIPVLQHPPTVQGDGLLLPPYSPSSGRVRVVPQTAPCLANPPLASTMVCHQHRPTLISKFRIAGMARPYFDSLPRGAYNTALGSSGSVENRRGRRRFAKERKAR